MLSSAHSYESFSWGSTVFMLFFLFGKPWCNKFQTKPSILSHDFLLVSPFQ